ncbi:MAG: sulfate adenylyltransferase [Eubacterium sp.]|nr:sulfate adenylyltransferase [Eubacterium sp.]
MKGLLKFITCGSVDDGKSTLIGHILYDAKLLYADQERALELDSKVGSREGAIDYSLLLDGLMAEREQGITIDVAYRYFTTDNRSFIVADTPGHEEYTRNMAVGASFAELAVILIDAKAGVLVQTRRHARICSLMGIKYFVFAVNKMDLAGYSEERFHEIEAQIQELSDELLLSSVKIIPVSATEGDNITTKSANMPWYGEEALLDYLENIDTSEKTMETGAYLPVQRVCRPNHEFRGFQGQVEAGEFHVGDEIEALPGSQRAKIRSVLIGDQPSESVCKGQPATIQLDREIDISRGSVIVKDAPITLSKKVTATILWMDDASLHTDQDYLIKIGTKQMPAMISSIHYKIDVNTGKHLPAVSLQKNEIAVCDIVLSENIAVDEFARHKTMGELILIDRVSHMTSACGVVDSTRGRGERDKMTTFEYGELKAGAGIFKEYYLNLFLDTITKESPHNGRFTVGDEVPVKGESYHYPAYLDMIILHEHMAVCIRDSRITKIVSTNDYTYEGYPIVNGRGCYVRAESQAQVEQFIYEFDRTQKDGAAQFYNRWLQFEKYRSIVFKDNYWGASNLS